MDEINVTVPEALREFVQSHATESGHQSVGELIRADQNQYALTVLGAEILKGAHSGPSVPMTDGDWHEIRHEVRERFNARKTG